MLVDVHQSLVQTYFTFETGIIDYVGLVLFGSLFLANIYISLQPKMPPRFRIFK